MLASCCLAGYARVAAVGVGEEKAAILPRPACYLLSAILLFCVLAGRFSICRFAEAACLASCALADFDYFWLWLLLWL